MRRSSIFALMALVAISCQQDFNEVANTAIEPNENSNPYAVSVEQALDRLYTELADIYGEGTRAANRSVKSVKTINAEDIAPATRSSENIDANELLYIVEFEDNQGSAILGADVRVDEVFAILDEDVISVEDFERAVSGEDDGAIDTYLAGLIADEAIQQVENSRIVIVNPPFRNSYYENVVIADNCKECYVRSKWSQDSPYNNQCTSSLNQICKAGDTTIAAAQIILRNAITRNLSTITINGQSFDVSDLKMRTVDYVIPVNRLAEVNAEVASYVKKLATTLGVTFGANYSTGSFSNIAVLMRNIGYRNVSYNLDDASAILDLLVNHMIDYELALAIKGTDSSNGQSHCWVIDAFFYEKFEKYWCTAENGVVISREYRGIGERTKVHCNFGWGGTCNGLYEFGIFDVSDTLDSEDIDISIGDSAGTQGDYQYNTNLELITYTL